MGVITKVHWRHDATAPANTVLSNVPDPDAYGITITADTTAEISNIHATDFYEGTLLVDQQTNLMYVQKNGAWSGIGGSGGGGTAGPPGPTGPTGPAGATGPAGPGVAVGGLPPQILSKKSTNDYDTQWVDPPVPVDEVFIGPNDPGFSYDMWYDSDAVAPTTGLIPAGGATGQALVKTSGADFATAWGPAPRPTNVPWGIVKSAFNVGAVVVPTSGLTLLHPPLVFTFIAGRQYKLNWHFRAVARTDNAASDAGVNMALYDGTVSTGWLDVWFLYRGQWSSIVGSMLFNDNQARSLAIGFGGAPTSLTIYPSQVWIEDIGPVPS